MAAAAVVAAAVFAGMALLAEVLAVIRLVAGMAKLAACGDFAGAASCANKNPHVKTRMQNNGAKKMGPSRFAIGPLGILVAGTGFEPVTFGL